MNGRDGEQGSLQRQYRQSAGEVDGFAFQRNPCIKLCIEAALNLRKRHRGRFIGNGKTERCDVVREIGGRPFFVIGNRNGQRTGGDALYANVLRPDQCHRSGRAMDSADRCHGQAQLDIRIVFAELGHVTLDPQTDVGGIAITGNEIDRNKTVGFARPAEQFLSFNTEHTKLFWNFDVVMCG